MFITHLIGLFVECKGGIEFLITLNVRLISCSISTYNAIIIVTTSINLSIIYNREIKRNYNNENVILFEILAYIVAKLYDKLHYFTYIILVLKPFQIFWSSHHINYVG